MPQWLLLRATYRRAARLGWIPLSPSVTSSNVGSTLADIEHHRVFGENDRSIEVRPNFDENGLAGAAYNNDIGKLPQRYRTYLFVEKSENLILSSN